MQNNNSLDDNQPLQLPARPWQCMLPGPRYSVESWQAGTALMICTALTSTSVMAQPSVNGNTISWPDDGWYQVQTTDGKTTLCEGGNSCALSPGDYLVINHTLGIRYPLVEVGEATQSPDIVVNGQTISWPDFGWFQVQSIDGLYTYCNGGRSCDVEPGLYNVINHTTGQRFENILVESSPTDFSSISVNGQRISWPDNGWYQVQSLDGISTYCNGEQYCDVSAGTYLVINHTTGERYSGVKVTDGLSAVINRDNHVEILEQVFRVYTGAIYEDRLPGVPTAFMESHISTPVEVPDDIVEANDYAAMTDYVCDNGGVLGYTLVSGFPYRVETAHWQDCLDGNVVKNGDVDSRDNNGYYGYYRYLLNANAYSADYSSGERIETDGRYGSISESNIDPAIRSMHRWTTEGFNYLWKNESTKLEIRDAVTDTHYVWTARRDSSFGAGITGSFSLSSIATNHDDVDVEMTDAMTASASGSFGSSYPDDWGFTKGRLDLSANDGSALRLEVDNGDVSTVQISLMQDGIVLESFQQPWSLWRSILTDIKADPRGRY